MGVLSEWDKAADMELLGAAQENAKDYTDTQVSSLSGVMDEINAKIDEVKAITEQAKSAAMNATTAANNAKAAADAAKSVAQTAANNASSINKIAGSMKTIPTRLKTSKTITEKNSRQLVVSINGLMFATDNANVDETLYEIIIEGEALFKCEVEVDGKSFTLGNNTYSYKILLPTGIKINSFKVYSTCEYSQRVEVRSESDTHKYFEYY